MAEVFCCSAMIGLMLALVAMTGALGDTTVFQNAQQDQLLSEANTKFALDLYKRHATSAAGQNIFMSPLSISVALAMTYLGARGRTKSQMKEVLHDVEEDHLHQAFTDILAALNKPQHAYKLYVANRLFGEKSYSFLQEFLSAGRKHYGAELSAVDFSGDSRGADEIINKWIAEKTDYKITKIVTSDAIDSLTRLVLVNAVYFKGDWLTKFDVKSTSDDDFNISPSESITVKMMDRTTEFNYGYNSDLNCKAIELPYSGANLSMFILLPDQLGTSLSQLEDKLTSADLINVKEKFAMKPVEVKVYLPRFSLDETLSLAEVLAQMGMGDLFAAGVADLSGVDGSKKLSESEVLHRAMVEVNEEGTGAAAAAAADRPTVVLSARRSWPIYFRADHPFLFFIQHKATKSIMFLGRLVKPPSV